MIANELSMNSDRRGEGDHGIVIWLNAGVFCDPAMLDHAVFVNYNNDPIGTNVSLDTPKSDKYCIVTVDDLPIQIGKQIEFKVVFSGEFRVGPWRVDADS